MDTGSLSNLSEEAESIIDFSISHPTGPTVSLYGNLSTERSKKDIQATRVAHVRFTRLTILGEGEPRNIVFAIGKEKSRRTLRSSPMDISTGQRTLPLNLTFSFIYTHTLKGPGDSFRVLLQERHKGGDLRLLASAPLHMHAVLQCPFAGELSLRAPGADGAPDGALWAKVQAVVASYTEDIESPEEAREWEDVLTRPEAHFKATAPAPAPAGPTPSGGAPVQGPAGGGDAEPLDEEEEREVHASLANRVRARMKKKLAQRGAAAAQTRFKGFKSLLSHAKDEAGSDSDDNKAEKMRVGERFADSASASAASDSLSDRSDFDDEAPRPRLRPDSSPVATPAHSHSHQHSDAPTPAPVPALSLPPSAASGSSTRDDSTSAPYVLLNPQKKSGKRLQELCERTPELRGACIEVKGPADAAAAASTLCNLYQQRAEQGPSRPLRVLLAGSDKLVQLVLRPFLEQIARRPRGWAASGFAFYLLPLGKRNDLAQHVGSVDAAYKTAFLAPDWTELWQRSDAGGAPLSAAEAQVVTSRVLRYLNDATQNVKFDIGEAWVSFAKADSPSASLQQTVPFLRGVQLGVEVRTDKKEMEVTDPPGKEVDLQVDYWVPSAAAGKKDEQVSMKHSFQCVALTRLPCVAATLRLERPAPTGFSLLLQWREKNKKVLGIGKAGSSRTVKMHTVPARAAKVTLAAEEAFAVRIDGVEMREVLGLSVSLQFAGPLKAFPIASFTAPPAAP